MPSSLPPIVFPLIVNCTLASCGVGEFTKSFAGMMSRPPFASKYGPTAPPKTVLGTPFVKRSLLVPLAPVYPASSEPENCSSFGGGDGDGAGDGEMAGDGGAAGGA